MNKLRDERKTRAFTQAHMAKMMSVDIRSYQRWEKGERKVPKFVDQTIDMMNQLDAIWDHLPDKVKKTLLSGVSRIAMMRKNR